ncbi:TetR/AcrR family transcriptional regulator [Bacillus sp. FJAT-52991]|uniref:TetR/AcrR family transcriptional regulator n=1 Tax=Bacillus kandeliae TaxID=3129297 RepID=A0ABZ2NAF4_9BACI
MNNDKKNEKQKQILLTAMNLFANKGYHQTSMKEIADVCEMSKGGLYLYFKSKEDLLLMILKYHFQMLDDQYVLVEQDPHLNIKEKFTKQMEISLKHAIEYEEFNNMRMQETIVDLENEAIHQYIQQKNIEMMQWWEKYLIGIYGEEVKPYCLDCMVILNGMILMFMKVLKIENLPIDTVEFTEYILRQLDYIVEGVLKDKEKPLIDGSLWSSKQGGLYKEKQHPLILIKKMKDQITQLPKEDRVEEALQSLGIMEQELMDMNPRKAIISGMIRNLLGIQELVEMTRELSSVLKSDIEM